MTAATAILKQQAPPLPPLPAVRAQVITKDRQIVDTTDDVWSFRASADGGRLLKIDWKFILPASSRLSLSSRSVHILKIYLAYRLTFSKGMTVWNDFVMFRRFVLWYAARPHSVGTYRCAPFDWSQVAEEMFRAFLEHGLSTASKGNDFARLREMYFWGAFGVQLPEFDRDLALALKTIRAQGNVKGAAVRFRDPLKGPLDPGDCRRCGNAV